MVQQLRQIRIDIEPVGRKFDLTVHTSEEDSFYPSVTSEALLELVGKSTERILSGLRTEGNDL